MAEYIFDTPGWLDWTLGARPYVYGSANLAGNTNYGGGGLLWRGSLLRGFYAEAGGGLSIHDGTIRIDDRITTPLSEAELAAKLARLTERHRTEIEFGSPVLFRGQVAIGYDFSDKWGADIFYEHLSNGNILGGSENGGINNVGFRLSRKF